MLKDDENILRGSVIQRNMKRNLGHYITNNCEAISFNKEKINNIQYNQINAIDYIKCLEERIQFMENIISNTLSLDNDIECNLLN